MIGILAALLCFAIFMAVFAMILVRLSGRAETPTAGENEDPSDR
jgi:hypothetical protein